MASSSSSSTRLVLTKLLGPLAGLIQGDFLVRARWLWLKDRLPRTVNGESLLDVGCGSGAFTICAAGRGYTSLGLTWDAEDSAMATARAEACKAAHRANFRVCDVRHLSEQHDLRGRFDFVICCENIEHILDDRLLVSAMNDCLKPGGRLLLTTPNYHYRPMTRREWGPFPPVEQGNHVRRGYSRGAILDIFQDSGFIIEKIGYCGGFGSQKMTAALRALSHPYMLGWMLTLPMRPFAPLIDTLMERLFLYPGYSITVEAYKPKRRLVAKRPSVADENLSQETTALLAVDT